MKRVLVVLVLVLLGTACQAFQSQFFQDERGGFFRLDFSVDEIPGVTADSLAIVSEGNKVFGLYKIDTARISSGENQVSENQWQFVNGNKEVQKLKRWENSLGQEAGKLSQRRGSLELILRQEKAGEFALDPIERSNIESKIADLKTKEEPFEKRISEVVTQRTQLEMELVAQFSENRKRLFREKPDFSILGRFSSPGPATLRLNNSRDGKKIMEIPLALPDIKGGDPELVQQWLKAQRNDLDQLEAETPGDSVFSYLKIQSARRLARDPKQAGVRPEEFSRQGRSSQPPDLYSILTGALAIQETLQLDRMGAGADQIAPSIPIRRLSGPNIRSHSYVEMLNNRVPHTLPIDELVPEEFYSCHFSDINRQIAFSDLLEQWGTSLFQTLRVSAHDAQAKEKYLRQLCLEKTELSRLFGDKAIDDLILCGADPFLHEGTDLSAVFSVRNRTLLDASLARFRMQAKASFPDAKEEDFSFGNTPIHVLSTPDRVVRSFACDLGEFKVVSNSRRALETIIDTFQDKHPSLADAPDYRYVRTVFPSEKGREDFFLYLSEKHIRQLVGPVWKVARQRRLHCVNSLRILQNSLALFGSEHATGTPSLERLVQEEFVDPSYLFCPDGGTYTLAGSDLQPVCSHHGSLRLFVPIIDQPPTLVTESEWDQYQKFVQDYNLNWAKFFDPIGIRGIIPPEGAPASGSGEVRLETCILPLVENPFYDGFKKFSSGVPVKMDFPTHPRTIVQFLCKLNLQDLRTWDASFERFFFTLTKNTSLTGGELVDALGESLSLNFVDTDLKYLINLGNAGPLLSFFQIFNDPFVRMLGESVLSGINVPSYAAIAVRDEQKVERFLRDWLRALSRESAMANLGASSSGGPEILAYDTISASGSPVIHTLDYPLFVLRLHFFFVVHDGHLIVANQRRIITDILAHPEIRTKAETNLALRLTVGNFNDVTQTTRLHWQERMRAVCRNNLGSLFALNRFRGIPPADWWEQSLRINGYAPFCPANGSYLIDPNLGTIRCSVHGDLLSPCQPFDLDMSVPLNRFVTSLKSVEASLSFTPEGIRTELKLDR